MKFKPLFLHPSFFLVEQNSLKNRFGIITKKKLGRL